MQPKPAPVATPPRIKRTLADAVAAKGGLTWPELVALELMKREENPHG